MTAPGASSLVISGAGVSDFNGTITGVTVNSLNNTITYNQTGPNESTGSATLTLTNYNNYVAYCGAETIAPPAVTLNSDNTPNVSSTLSLEPNNCQWTAGNAVIQANSDAQQVYLEDLVGNGLLLP
jgi:hypothetical protein